MFVNKILNVFKFIHISVLPPKQAPNESDHINGWRGRFSSLSFERFAAILTIIVVRGRLSTKADANTDTHSIKTIAVANLDSGPTDVIIYCVCFPIQLIRPNRERA